MLEAVSDLDFSASAAARGLRTTKSSLVGYLVPAINNDIFSRVAEVLEEDLRQEGVGLVIVSSGWDAEGERHGLQSLRDHRVDTLVLSTGQRPRRRDGRRCCRRSAGRSC